MVNREQEVIDRVHSDRVVSTEPLREMFSIEHFKEPLLSDTEEKVFEVDTMGHHANTAVNGSIVTPVDVDEQESFDLFSKLQDEELMDALDPTREPPAGCEHGREGVVATMMAKAW